MSAFVEDAFAARTGNPRNQILTRCHASLMCLHVKGVTMERFVFYLRPIDPSEIEEQRQACHRLAGDNAEVVAEFIDCSRDSYQELQQALELSSTVGATFVCGTA